LRVLFGQRWFSSLQVRFDFLLLLLWTAIGGILRLTQLTAKPPWTDEFATLVFSLGNNFKSVPLDRIISLDTLLQPLQVNPDATISDVVSLLVHEDNHPPLYFVLAHLWMKLFPPTGEYVNLWAARSLPVMFGTLSIPAIYYLANVSFNSRLMGQLSAALMSVSPYGIFLSQEARHYTLVILFVIASLGCFLAAIKYLWQPKTIPRWLIFSWAIVNAFGLSTHYFFGLTLIAEFMTLIVFLFSLSPFHSLSKNYWRLGMVVIGAIAIGLFWLSITPKDYGNGMIDWIQFDKKTSLELISPIFQLLASWITFISLLPIESSNLPLVILSGAIMLVFFLWFFPVIHQGLKIVRKNPSYYLQIKSLYGLMISIVILFVYLTYFWGIDITRGARYNFIYFPAVIVLFGAGLAAFWRKTNKFYLFFDWKKAHGMRIFLIVFIMGFLSSITVCSNLGYQKYYRPDLLASIIQKKSSSVPTLIVMPYKSLVQTGEIMGIAWELKDNYLRDRTSFLLAHQPQESYQKFNLNLQEYIVESSKPLDLWALNFTDPLRINGCQIDTQKKLSIEGYDYKIYHCL
jgi:uncharacterized membrane protein